MKNKKALLINLIFAAVLLICAGAMLAARSANNAANSAAQSAADQSGASAASLLQAQLTYGDDNAVMDISLDEDATYDVDTGYYTVHIEVKDRAARFQMFMQRRPPHPPAGFHLPIGEVVGIQ